MLEDMLKSFLAPGPERVGFILDNGDIVEVPNISDKPNESFSVSTNILSTYEDRMVATWHTHPGGSSNLSVEDLDGFLAWPDQRHYVIGEDGVRCYVVKDGAVLNA